MKITRTFTIIGLLIIVLGLLTVTLAFAGEGPTRDSLVSVTGGPANASGERGESPDLVGTLLIDQPPNQTNGLFSDADCGSCASGQQAIADDFILADAYNIDNIVLWGGFFPGNTFSPDDFRVRFLGNTGGNLPDTGNVLYDESTVPASSSTTGVILFGVNEYRTVLTLTNPLSLTAGTYWVEIFHNTAGSADSYFWEVGNQDAVNGRLNNAFATNTPGTTWNPGNPLSDNAFQIWGSQGAPPPAPDIDISKTPTFQDVYINGDAFFTITVTNTGDIQLDNVTVTDALVPDCDAVLGSMAPGASTSYACTDVGVLASYTNVADVTSTIDTVPGPSDSASAQVNVIDGGIEIAKTPDYQNIVSGGTANFTITVTNTGQASLGNVTVTDALSADCDAVIGSLAAGESSTYTCSELGVGASFTNTAVVTGAVDGNLPPLMDMDDAFVEVNQPTSVSLTGIGSESAAISPIWLAVLLAVLGGFGLAIRRRLIT